MSSEWKDVGARLKALREAKGITAQAAMARLIGATPEQYNNWERGAGALPVQYAIRIYSFTGAGLDYIYRGDFSGLPVNLITLLSPSIEAFKVEPPKARTRKRSK